MTEQLPHKPENHRQPKARRFYIIEPRLTDKRANFEVVNLDVLRAGALALYPPEEGVVFQTTGKGREL